MRKSLVLLACLLLSACGTTPEGPKEPPASKVEASTLENEYTVVLDARSEWFNTGIHVRKGQTVDFTASGSWGESPGVTRTANGGQAGMFGSGYWGLQPIVPGAPWGSLVGKIGSQEFPIGTLGSVTADNGGILQLSINDGLGAFHDNHGSLTVKVRVEP